MRHLKALLVALALSWGQLAFAPMADAGSMLSMMGVGPGQNIVPASFQFNASGSSGGNSVTITNSAIGPADPSRYVVVGMTCASGQTNSVSSVTIGGNAATQLVATTGGQVGNSGFYGLSVPTGTTATIVATFSGTCNAITTAGSWSLYNLNSQTPTASQAVRAANAAPTGTVGVGAFVLAVCESGSGASFASMTQRWTFATSTLRGTGADATSGTSSYTASCTNNSGGTAAMVAFK